MIKIGVGIATPGHVIAIPKLHFPCLADVPDNLLDDYEGKIHPILQGEIEEHFSAPFSVEYGIFGQTVPHAHVHYIPLSGEGYSLQSVVREILPKTGIPILKGNRQTLRDTRKKHGRYNFFIEGKNSFVCPIPADISEETSKFLDQELNYRYFLKVRGGKVPLIWGKITPEEKRRDDAWKEETREKLKGLAHILATA